MKFIKIYWGNEQYGYMVSVRTNLYSCSLAHIQKLIAVLRKDHPDQEIDADDITIVIYNTDSFKGMMGVKWHTPKPNKSYFNVDMAPCKF